MKKFFDNIECTKEIILYTTILSNNASEKWEEDAKKIIDFICLAYDLKLEDDYLKLIAYEISNLSTLNEYRLLFSKANFSDNFEDINVLYDIKGRAMTTINQIFKRIENVNFGMFSYFDYNSVNPYNDIERRTSLLQASRFGDVELSVMAGILYATGIGGKQNLRLAKLRFLQAAYWGCFPAFKYVAIVSKMLEENVDAKTAKEMLGISSQISDLDFIKDAVNAVLEENPQAIIDYKEGTGRALGFLVGQIMKKTQGKINPKLTSDLLLEELKKR